MANNYTRQSTITDGDTIAASLFNNEYNELVSAFSYSNSNASITGHRHDGSTGQGGNIFKIGDLDFKNKIEVNSTDNYWGMFVEVGGVSVEQLRVQDGAIVPVTNNDIDLGSSSFNFKNINSVGTLKTGSINTTGTISPTVNNTNDLGTTSLRFKDIYTAGTVYANNLTVTGILTAAINPTSINGGTY